VTAFIAFALTAGGHPSPVTPVAAWHKLHLATMPLSTWAYIAVALSSMLGMDTAVWLGFSSIDGTLSLAPGYGPDATSLLVLTPIPQAWTIGLELTFYLLAPYLVRRSWWVIAALIAATLLVRIAGRVDAYPWDRSLFPLELVFFLLGISAFKLRALVQRGPVGRALAIVCIFGVVLSRPVSIQYPSFLLDLAGCCLLAAALPSLFGWTKYSNLDRRLGDLSYPLYLVHVAVFAVGLNLVGAVGTWWANVGLLASAVLLAWLLDALFARPMERWRRGKGIGPATPHPAYGSPGPVSAPGAG
jgi:peptidoglycan/LPS O-acetylase OafA/YrhL